MDDSQRIPTQKTSPKDFFLHLLAIATLYASAINFGTLIFKYIDLALPDPLSYDTTQWSY